MDRISSAMTDLPAPGMVNAINRLEEILRGQGIEIKSGSALEAGFLTVYQFEIDERAGASKKEASNVDNRQEFRKALSLEWFAERIAIARGHPDFASIVPHISLLGQTENYAHCAPSGQFQVWDAVSDKLFELQVALNVYPWGSNIRLDHPVKSSGGANPDILFEFDNTTWGVACKNLRSTSPRQFRENVLQGIAQIERSPADLGLVFVNTREVVDHDLFFELKRDPETDLLMCCVWPDPRVASDHLARVVSDQLGLAISSEGHNGLREACLKAECAVVISASTVAIAQRGAETKAFQINHTSLCRFSSSSSLMNAEGIEHARKFKLFLDMYSSSPILIG
jgi:hypothetical protein